ncbi:MAG: MFS transporter [Proteobacteria bacterium]|nr:MFS transporter [Pseudomonadota bacterium]
MNRPDLSIAALAPFFLSSFAWNFALGSTYILVPLYALSLGMTGVQIGALVALPVVLQIILNLVGGAFSDRLGGKNLAMASCVMTVLAALLYMVTASLALMFVAQLMMITARAMFWPATWSMASQLPGPSGVQMGRLNGSTNAGQICGTAGAGFIIVEAGFRAGFAAMAAAGLIALILNQVFRHAVRPRGAHQPMLATYRMLLKKRSLRYAMVCAYISALPISLSFSFYPILLVEQGFDSDVTGSLISLRAVGAIAAGFIAGHLVKQVRSVGTPLIAAVVTGLSVALAAAFSQGLLIALFMLGLGAGSALMTIYFQMLISMVSTSETRGSAMALAGMGWGVSHLSTPLLIGVFRDWLDIHTAFYIIGGLALLCGLALVPLQRWAFAGPE